jgi:hypothetical protein
LLFAKAGSAATLSQQEKNNSANVWWAALSLAAMYLAGIFAAHRRGMFKPLLRHKISAWGSSGPAVGKQNHFFRPQTATSTKSMNLPAA